MRERIAGLALPQDPALRTSLTHAVGRGLVVTLIAIAVVELVLRVLLEVPTLTVLVAVVAYVAYRGGTLPGLLSVSVVSLYGSYYFSTPGQLFEYTHDNLVRLATLPPTLVVVALIVGGLRRAVDGSIRNLRRQRDFSRAIDESLGEGVYAINATGRVTYVNPAAERMLGWTEAELLDQVMHDRIHYMRPDGTDFPREECRGLVDVLNRGMTVHIDDDVFIRKGGEMFPVAYSSSPIEMDGRVVGAVVAFRDISERKRSEQRLAIQYEVSRSLAESSDLRDAAPRVLAAIGKSLRWDYGGLWVMDPGYSQLLCVDAWEAEPGRLGEFVAASRRTAFQRGEGLPGDVWERGEPRWLEDVSAEPSFPRLAAGYYEGLRSGFGLPIELDGRVVAVIEFLSREARPFDPDVLDAAASLGVQICQFMERNRAEEELRRAEEKYRGIFENSVDGIFQSTRDGQMLTANPSLARILGYDSPEELIACVRDVGEQLYVDPSRRQTLARLLGQQGEVSGFEVQVYRKDGEVIWTKSNVRPIRDEHGEIVGYEGTVEDVTERKEGEQRLAVQYEVSRVLAEGWSLEEAAPRVLGAIGEGLGWDYGALWIVEGGAGVLRCAETWYAEGAGMERFIAESRRSEFRPGEGLPGAIWEACEPRWVADTSAQRNFPRLAIALSEGLRSGFGLPIILAGRVVAVIEFLSRELRRRDEDILAVMGALGGQIGQFIERVRAEGEVRRSEERLRLLVEGARDYAMMMLSPDGRIESWNAGAERLYRYSEQEALGSHFAMIFTSEDRAAGVPERELEQAITEGRASDEGWAERKDGSRFWANGATTALWDEGGHLRGLAKVARDITWRKLAEEALEARARQQAAVADLGRRAISELDLGVLMGEAVSLVADVLGVEYCKVLELCPGGEELRLVAGVGWREGLVGQATVGTGLDSQAGYTLASGGPVIVQDLATETRFSGPPLLHEHGVVSGLSAIIGGQDGPYGVLGAHTRKHREFTPDDANFLQTVANVLATAIRRRRFEERLASERGQAERLAELDRLRRDFVSSVSHELRTPLTAIVSGLGFLEAGVAGRVGEAEARLLANARRNAARLGRLINDLLAYNQLEAGTLELERGPLDLRAVVADATSMVQPLLEEKGQELSLDLPEPLPMEGDAYRLGQVVINLLGNVHGHTPPGTRVTVSGRCKGDRVLLTVADNGPGVPAEHLRTIFERFRSLDSASKGSGLGLAISRGIVALHGGRIWAEDRPGGGVAFRVELPAAEGVDL